jgi:hypothetical protein
MTVEDAIKFARFTAMKNSDFNHQRGRPKQPKRQAWQGRPRQVNSGAQ